VQCGTRFAIRDGIADLRLARKDYYFNPVSRPKMAEIMRDISAESWPRAVRQFLAEVRFNPDWLDNLVTDGRYAWKLFLGLAPKAKVLDLGCGLGNLTKNVAPHVGEMYALDLTWERLQFAKRRFSVFNKNDNISLVAGGDGEHLPFADGTLDCVIVSGVLEWVADDSTPWDSVPGKLSKLWKMLRAHIGRSAGCSSLLDSSLSPLKTGWAMSTLPDTQTTTADYPMRHFCRACWPRCMRFLSPIVLIVHTPIPIPATGDY
jgi:SAM-dependent methyltransferase